MAWTSVEEALPGEGLECVLVCMLPDGSVVQAVGYRLDGKWVIDAQDPAGWKVRRWMPLVRAQKIS